MGWVFGVGYMTQPLLSVQKKNYHLYQSDCAGFMFLRPMYLGLVVLTDISCHKTRTSLISCAFLVLRLSPLPNLASCKIRKPGCTMVASPKSKKPGTWNVHLPLCSVRWKRVELYLNSRHTPSWRAQGQICTFLPIYYIILAVFYRVTGAE